MFKIGDKVSFINGTGIGTILTLKKTGRYVVELDGMDIEFEENDLVPTIDFTNSSKDKNIKDLINKQKIEKILSGLFLGFKIILDKSNNFTQLEIELINFTNLEYYVILSNQFEGITKIFNQQRLDLNSVNSYFKFSALDTPSTFNLYINLIETPCLANNFSKLKHIEFPLKIKLSKILNDSKIENSLEGKYFLAPILGVNSKEKQEDLIEISKPIKGQLADVIDLHLDKITDKLTYLKVRNYALEFQMVHLKHILEIAVLTNKEQLVIVHGIGEGVLRTSIHQYLEERKDIIAHYRPANPNLYGINGGTEIFFTY